MSFWSTLSEDELRRLAIRRADRRRGWAKYRAASPDLFLLKGLGWGILGAAGIAGLIIYGLVLAVPYMATLVGSFLLGFFMFAH